MMPKWHHPDISSGDVRESRTPNKLKLYGASLFSKIGLDYYNLKLQLRITHGSDQKLTPTKTTQDYTTTYQIQTYFTQTANAENRERREPRKPRTALVQIHITL